MVGNNLTEKQLQEIVDKTILYADKDGDGKISYEEFCDVSFWCSLYEIASNIIALHYFLVSTIFFSLLGGGYYGRAIKDGNRLER